MTDACPEVVTNSQLSLKPWQSDELYRALFADANDSLYLLHPQSGRIIDCNKKASRLNGLGEEEIVGMMLADIWLPDKDREFDAGPETDLLLPGLCAGLSIGAHKRKDGTLVPVELNSHMVKFQDQHFILCVERDITERKQAEDALRGSEEHYRALAESAQDLIFVVGHDDKITYINNFAAEQIGIHPAETMGRPRCDLIPMELSREQRDGLRRVFESGETLCLESKTHFPDREAWLSTCFTPLFDDEGNVTSVLGISRDITEKKAAEHEVHRDKEELEQWNRELSILFDISSAITKEMSIDKMLNQTLEMIIELGLLKVQKKGGIFLIEDNNMHLAAHCGHDDEFILAHQNLKVGECICGRVAASGTQIVCSNVDREKHHSIRFPKMEPHGHIVIPLRTGNNTVGVLFLYLPPDRNVEDRKLRLLMAIGNQLAVAIEKIRLYEKTKMLSLHDPLTGLANRHFMSMSLRSNMAAAKRSGRSFSLIMMDLDNFKQYNDAFGHVAGDKLLSDVGRLLINEVREVDLVARYGGEEFLIVLPDTGEKETVEVAERIREQMSSSEFSYSRNRPPARMTISAGVATFDNSVSEEDVLVARADAALYRAKQNGRNRVMSWLTTH